MTSSLSSTTESRKPSTVVDTSYLRTAFLAQIAHDIRAPGGVAMGALAELQEALGSAADDQRIWFTMLRRALKRLIRLADRLSLVAELESGPLEVSRTLVDIGALTAACVESATFIQGRSAVAVTTDISPDRHPCLADVRWLEPALIELVCNAIRFAYRRIRVSVMSEGAYTNIVIEDDGAGISLASMETLFSRFVARNGASGLGLSMSIAHEVIVGHRGHIRVESSQLPIGRGPSPGARIVISLPKAPR